MDSATSYARPRRRMVLSNLFCFVMRAMERSVMIPATTTNSTRPKPRFKPGRKKSLQQKRSHICKIRNRRAHNEERCIGYLAFHCKASALRIQREKKESEAECSSYPNSQEERDESLREP